MIKSKINIDHDLDYSFLKKVTDYFENKNENLQIRGIYIFGKCGVGKSNFLKKINSNSKKPISFINLVDWIQKHMLSWGKGYEGINIISTSSAATATNLFLDDFGAEYIHTSTSTYLYNLLEKRVEYKKFKNGIVTIITSNLSIENLENKYNKLLSKTESQRIISRLKNLIDLEIEFEGTDKRSQSAITSKYLKDIDFNLSTEKKIND